MAYRLTVRTGPKVSRERHATLAAALDALQARVDELAGAPQPGARRAFHREYEPVAQVTGRVEVAGSTRLGARARGGIDVRGDGSTEAYVGKVRRELVEQLPGESAVDALRRVLCAS